VTAPDVLLREASALTARLDVLSRRWECDDPSCDGRPHEGWLHPHARASQREPDEYRTWALVTGRGFGKTRTGAETAKKWGMGGSRHIAVVAKTDREVRSICFEGPAGLLSVIPRGEVSVYNRGPGGTRLILKNGCLFTAFTSETPDNLRGYAFDGAWCDEYAAWPRQTAQDVYDMLWFCLRESPNPRVIVTTTPKPTPHVRALLARAAIDPSVVVTRGSTLDNASNLTAVALDELHERYAGTRLGRQELAGELLEDVEGALWTLALIDQHRVDRLPEGGVTRRVVAVDPAMTANAGSDETGIIVASIAEGHGYVEADYSLKASPQGWAERVVHAYDTHACDAVIVEDNAGGDMTESTLRTVHPTLPIKRVHASDGKRLRAEPISSLYEQGKVHHVGTLHTLEDQMATWTPDVGKSPDRLDALVHGMTELFRRGQTLVAPLSLTQKNQWRP
jgi:phage terminase large subunit-like protein